VTVTLWLLVFQDQRGVDSVWPFTLEGDVYRELHRWFPETRDVADTDLVEHLLGRGYVLSVHERQVALPDPT